MIWAQNKFPAQISLSNGLCPFRTPLTLNVFSSLFTCSSLLFVSLFQRRAPTMMNREQGKDCGCSCSWPLDAFLLMPNWKHEGSSNGDPVEEGHGWWISLPVEKPAILQQSSAVRMDYSKGKGGINSHLTPFNYNPWSSVIRNLCNLPLITVWCFLTSWQRLIILYEHTGCQRL